MRSLRNIGIVTVVIGALITLGIMVFETSAVNSLSDLLITLGLYVWALLPFLVLVGLTFYIHRKGLSPASRVAILLTSVAVVVPTVFIYWASLVNTSWISFLYSESSTSALLFLFIPLYGLIATALVYGLAWLSLKPFMPEPKGRQ